MCKDCGCQQADEPVVPTDPMAPAEETTPGEIETPEIPIEIPPEMPAESTEGAEEEPKDDEVM